MQKIQSIAPNILRIGIAIVMLWFGVSQLIDPGAWTGFLPDFIKAFPVSDIAFVKINGLFEVLAGLLLITGYYIRIVSALLALHLIGIIFSLGYSPIAVRDFGLTIALISIFMQGSDSWSLDKCSRTE